METTSYSLQVRTNLGYDEAVSAVLEALKAEGFGLLTEIDVQATLKQKLDVDFKRYVILGMCNPGLAHRALQLEEELGLLLPCNVIVYETDSGVVVSAVNPEMMAEATDNPELRTVAAEATEMLGLALHKVAGM